LDLNYMQQKAEEGARTELERILGLEVREQFTPEQVDLVSWYYLKPERYSEGKRLLPRQAEALAGYNDAGGVFGPIGVGEGKTLTSLLIADDCYRYCIESGITPRVLMLVPAQVVEQLRGTGVAMARDWTRFTCPVHFLSGQSKGRREMLARSQRRGLYVMSYSTLSLPTAEALLCYITPACLICDEAHNLMGGRNSARARRFKRYVNDKRPQVVALSGTMTTKTPMDYHYLARASLQEGNFLPNIVSMAENWSAEVGSEGTRDGACAARGRLLLPLVRWAQNKFPGEAATFSPDVVGKRRALQRRMLVPGVAMSVGESLGTSLYIINDKTASEGCEGHEEKERLVAQLRDEWKSPCGDELKLAMLVWQWRYQIEGGGFYYELYWPDIETVMRRKSVKEPEAVDMLRRSRQHHETVNEYNKALREWLAYSSKPHLDSPFLVETSLGRHGAQFVGAALYGAWARTRDSDFDGRIDRDSRTVRVCPYKVDACADFVERFMGREDRDGRGIIIWWMHKAVGAWIHETLTRRGIASELLDRGPAANRYLLDSGRLKGRVLCLGMSAHGTGKDLQHGFSRNYMLQWPRSAKMAEQVMGRTHRTGQQDDEVHVYTNVSCEFDEVTLSSTLNEAAYVSQANSRQRVLYATYDPVPRKMPYPVLVEWGLSPKTLTIEQEAWMPGQGK